MNQNQTNRHFSGYLYSVHDVPEQYSPGTAGVHTAAMGTAAVHVMTISMGVFTGTIVVVVQHLVRGYCRIRNVEIVGNGAEISVLDQGPNGDRHRNGYDDNGHDNSWYRKRYRQSYPESYTENDFSGYFYSLVHRIHDWVSGIGFGRGWSWGTWFRFWDFHCLPFALHLDTTGVKKRQSSIFWVHTARCVALRSITT